uniref:Uncharacterized protein n=1 Tax=Schistosoma haematobium TaxID=6185 RepID=A0A095CB38_SCHHA
MIEYVNRHEIFNPSVSWITKSGVHLEYTPEDTLKSGIFVSGENATPCETVPMLNSEVCSNNSEFKDCDGDLYNIDVKKPTKNPISSKKPISFLKRHQGVSAWCSRLRKQGLPVTDPAAELLKRQCTNSSQIPIVRKTALKKRLDLSKSNSKQTPINNDALIPSTINKDSNHSQYNQSFTNINSINLNDPTHIHTLNINKENPIEKSKNILNHKSNKDLIGSIESIHTNMNDDENDLKEFEYLEEFIETSLYNHNDINKKQFKNRIQSNQLSMISYHSNESIKIKQPSSHVQIHSRHSVKDDILIEDKIHRDDAVNCLTGESHDAKTASDFNLPNNNSDDCNVNSILGIPGPLDNQCKVTRFHVAKLPCNQSQSSVINNQQLELSNEHQLASMKQFSSSTPDDYDFDDSHPWSFSTTDINDAKLLTGYNLSEVSLTNCGKFNNIKFIHLF